MGGVFRFFVRLIKVAILAVVTVELLCFLFISLSNYLIYGKITEGSKVRYDPYALFLNREGQRPTVYNHSGDEAEKNRVVWAFGGSTMRGVTPDDSRTVASFLARDLNALGSGLNYAVENFGENSFNSLLEVQYLQKVVIEREDIPDLILFYDGPNECSYLAQHRTADGHHGYRRASALIESYHRSFFGLLKPLNAAAHASFTRELYDKVMEAFVPMRADDPVLREYVDRAEKRYDYIARQTEAVGSRFVLALQPILWAETEPVAEPVRAQEAGHFINAERFRAMRHNFRIVYDALADRLSGKAYFVDMRNALCPREVPVYLPDGIHLNDVGRSMAARHLSKVLPGYLD